jgi:hypothetical protein
MREIADLTGATEGAIRMRHLRALEGLKRKMEEV